MFEIREMQDLTDLLVTGPWGPEAARVIEEGGIDRVTFRHVEEEDLRFLEGLPVRGLLIHDPFLGSLEGLEGLGGSLESLRLWVNPKLKVNVAALPKLRKLAVDWAQIASSKGSNSSVTDLELNRYSEDSLGPLISLFPSLVRLRCIDRTGLSSLDALNGSTMFEKLCVPLSPKLVSIEGLHGQKRLKELDIYGCRKICDLDVISQCSALEVLDIAECGTISSLSPLRGLKSLVRLRMSGSTRVEDDDLSVLMQLPLLTELRIMGRKSYRPPAKAVLEYLESMKD